jgi:lipopolysaccharide/colanic/teichoic acid biosynthesis glycosyltransferase
LARYLKDKSENRFASTDFLTGLRERELLKIFQEINRTDQQNGRRVLLSEEQFRTLVLHECARCDRNCHQFSLIQIDLRTEEGRRAEAGLIKKILKRIRTTDEAGWLDSNSLGIFLPETNREGARVFIADICEGQTYQIYTYPDLKTFKEDKQPCKDDGSNSCDPEQVENPLEDSRIEGMHEADRSIPVHRAAVTQEVESIVHAVKSPAWKRIVDVGVSIIALVLLSPVFLVIAVYIKLISRGPVLFRQERIGYLGRPFTILKFRTMKMDADCDIHKSHLKELINGDRILKKLDQEKDCRLIPLAGLLRKTCLDELPQFFNVLKGEMSLVGPRPVLYYEAEEFSLWQRQRFHALPGMTGLWQVSGKNRLTHSQMMRLDARYSRNADFAMDFVIFLKTIPAIAGQVIDSVRGKPARPDRQREASKVSFRTIQ